MIMKLALLAVLYLSSAVADTCQIYKCATSVGSACGTTGTANPTTQTFCTGSNQFCNGTSNVCQALFANGHSCNQLDFGAYCQSGYCRAGDNTCQNGDLANGQACVNNADCDSENCSNKVCVGANVGGSCTSTANCNEADYLYCNSGTCANFVFVGLNGGCSSSGGSGNQCGFGLFCNSNSKCVPDYSVGSGGTCGDDTTTTSGQDTDNECGDGLTCQSGKCASAPSSSNAKCQQDSDCTQSGEACVCNYNTGAGTCQTRYINQLSGATAVANDITSCYSGSCSSAPTGDCALSKCKSSYCAGQKFLVATNNQGSNNLPSCYVSANAESVPSVCNGASSVAVSAFVVFAAAAALMM